VRLSEQGLADDVHASARRGGLDRRPQSGTAGADYENVRRQALKILAQKIHLGSWMTPAINNLM